MLTLHRWLPCALVIVAATLSAVVARAQPPVDPLAACRAALFSCAPSACPDLAVAAQECDEAVAAVPGDETAHFFRGLTGFLATLEVPSVSALLDGFGLDAQARHLWDWKAKPPRIGSLDGSISRRDPFLAWYLEPGSYFLAIAPSGTPLADIVGGETAVGELYEATDAGDGTFQLSPAPSGAYRVTFSANAVVTSLPAGELVVDGSLERDPGSGLVGVDLVGFSVGEAGIVTFDLLSWEVRSDAGGGTFAVRQDLNGDGMFQFFDAEMTLLADDGTQLLCAANGRCARDDSSSRGRLLPSDSPGGSEAQQVLVDELLPRIDAALADLALIEPPLEIALSGEELIVLGVDLGVDANDAPVPHYPVEVDYGDAKLLESMLLTLKSVLSIGEALDLGIDIDEFTPVAVWQALIDAKPDFLRIRNDLPDAMSELEKGRLALRDAIESYLAATAYIRGEPDPQWDDLFALEGDEAFQRDLAVHLAAVKRSLAEATSFLCSESLQGARWRRKFKRLVGSSPDIESGATLQLGRLLDGTFDPRDALPVVRFDPDELDNSVQAAVGRCAAGAPELLRRHCFDDAECGAGGDCSFAAGGDTETSAFPDSTFNAAVGPIGVDPDCDGDGIVDVFATADACADGQIEGCFDSCRVTPNGPVAGSCIAGPDYRLGEACGADADCGPGGLCSLAQEDRDGDLVGDACDICPDAHNPDQVPPVVEIVVRGGSDEVQPGVRVTSDGDGGPIVGDGLLFGCSPCGVADLGTLVDRIGGGQPFCGYDERVPRQIVENGDPLCAEVIGSGERYDIELLSFGGGGDLGFCDAGTCSRGVRDGLACCPDGFCDSSFSICVGGDRDGRPCCPSGRECVDADAGASCAAAGDGTSYRRTRQGEIGERVVSFGSFFDEFEPDVGIDVDPEGGPLEGNALEFSCGPCEDATFANAASEIGGGHELCGYTSMVPREILANGDLVCARNRYSGALYEIELLSFRSRGSGCFDGDGGMSCAATGDATSYRRPLLVISDSECSAVLDSDGDGVPDDGDGSGVAGDSPCAEGESVGCDDSCPREDNPGQVDVDLDGFGNACDGDFDQDGFVGDLDEAVFMACFGQPVGVAGPGDDPDCSESDMTGDGFVGGPDYTLFLQVFGHTLSAPGQQEPVGSGGLVCGLGGEVVPLLILLMVLRRSRRRGAP